MGWTGYGCAWRAMAGDKGGDRQGDKCRAQCHRYTSRTRVLHLGTGKASAILGAEYQRKTPTGTAGNLTGERLHVAIDSVNTLSQTHRRVQAQPSPGKATVALFIAQRGMMDNDKLWQFLGRNSGLPLFSDTGVQFHFWEEDGWIKVALVIEDDTTHQNLKEQDVGALIREWQARLIDFQGPWACGRRDGLLRISGVSL